MSRFATFLCAGIFSACLQPACSYEEAPLTIPAPDRETFESDVYPVLLRDCGFPACHGAPGRFFRIFGPGRSRLRAGTTDLLDYDPPTAAELAESYDRARSMLKGVHGVEDSLLLCKPLAVRAGGAGHEGNDTWGQNVYQSAGDPGYRALRAWALGSERSNTDDTEEEQP